MSNATSIKAQRRSTPLPRLQLLIVYLIQIAEPITALVIYPFIVQLVRDTDITNGDETKIGYYAGIIVGHKKSAYFFITMIIFLATGVYFLSGTMFDCRPMGILVRQSWP